jgi:transcriptional regulator with PAS, ATPase and Fis domain
MMEIARHIDRVAGNDIAVCILGETGTGKELVARAIHDRSARSRGAFVAINCAAIPESLQESELFGHERGAFTGALQTRKGRLEQANGGTLFLDELGEMSLSTQAALLRAIQERTIRRVGGTVDIPIDLRIVCATHSDLKRAVAERRFREDLYYRLVVYPIELPPLRERPEDIPLLVEHFLAGLGAGSQVVEPEAIEALQAHAFPGNIRELQNVVHRSLLDAEGGAIRLDHLPRELRGAPLPASVEESPPPTAREGAAASRGRSLRDLEREAIREAVAASNGSVTKAAKLLGIGRATLYRRLSEDATLVGGR